MGKYWAEKSKPKGRPPIAQEIVDEIRRLNSENRLWGSPRIQGELAKLGHKVAKSTIERYMKPRSIFPGGGTWMTFLRNQAKAIACVDSLTVPTLTFGTLSVMVIMSIDRRRVLHFAVTSRPTGRWAARQITHALAGQKAIKYLLRDNDRIYSGVFDYAVAALGIETIRTVPRSPWQNPYAERLNGSIRRDCLDHVIVCGEDHLRVILANYFDYYHAARTHLGLKKDAPIPRAIEGPELGKVVSMPFVGGLHHRYSRRAA